MHTLGCYPLRSCRCQEEVLVSFPELRTPISRTFKSSLLLPLRGSGLASLDFASSLLALANSILVYLGLKRRHSKTRGPSTKRQDKELKD